MTKIKCLVSALTCIGCGALALWGTAVVGSELDNSPAGNVAPTSGVMRMAAPLPSVVHPNPSTNKVAGDILKTQSADLSILDMDTWNFLPQQSVALNAVPPKIIEARINKAVTAATGGWPGGTLQEFKVVDLNADGIYEIVARIDYSGRGRALGLSVISRGKGRYYQDTVPTWGAEKGMTFWGNSGHNLIIGTEPMGSWCTVDPLISMVALYEWTGTNSVDVSKANEKYYRTVFVPGLTNRVVAYSVKGPDNEIERHDETIKLAQLALLIPKVNSMFHPPLVPPDVVRTLSRLMVSFHPNKNERKDVVEQFRIAQASLSLEENGGHDSVSTDETVP